MKNQRQSNTQPTAVSNQAQQPYYHNIKSERKYFFCIFKFQVSMSSDKSHFTLDQSSSPVGNFGMNQGAPSSEVLPNSYPITSVGHSQVSQFLTLKGP